MPLLRSFGFMLLAVFAFTALLNAEAEYKYSYVPKKIYENQLFPLTVIDTARTKDDNPRFQFDPVSPVQPVFQEPLVVHNGSDSFYTFYFKADKVDVMIPRLFIVSGSVDTSLDPQTIPLAHLQPRKDFCGVLAADMKIKGSQVSNYDEKNHLVTLSIEAYEANLEDMHLKHVEESGLEDLHRKFAKVTAEFYVVLPLKQKNIRFTYFNTIKNQYVFLEASAELADDSVTTQSDLNPKEDSFEKLKKYTFVFLTGFFLLMSLIKRDFFFLVLGVISLITLLTFYIPHKKICVKQGAPLYLLPTQTSTIGTKIDEDFETPLLGKREEFRKIEYKNGIIGWVKNEDLCKN
ncbi:Putative periplasmic protein [hydrothermal vent metagenome]|uniref:Putative periplasmic protein n=1 Tax=hydrothermal vent metagenome TaxID=652676 RepID=A0A1W1C1N4_9ZZZZ